MCANLCLCVGSRTPTDLKVTADLDSASYSVLALSASSLGHLLDFQSECVLGWNWDTETQTAAVEVQNVSCGHWCH